jgi:hypothetical protein
MVPDKDIGLPDEHPSRRIHRTADYTVRQKKRQGIGQEFKNIAGWFLRYIARVKEREGVICIDENRVVRQTIALQVEQKVLQFQIRGEQWECKLGGMVGRVQYFRSLTFYKQTKVQCPR